MRVGIIGFGRMGSAIGKSLSGTLMGNAILCADTNLQKLKEAEKIGLRAASSPAEIAQKCDYIFLCVKPKDLDGVLAQMRPFAVAQVFLSIAAGKRIAGIEAALGEGSQVVRVMPNIAALARASVNVYTCRNVPAREESEVLRLLELFGKAVKMDERNFDSVTGLSGSGPAFAAYFIECLAQAGKTNGLSIEDAQTLALETVLGTAKLMKERNLSSAQVIEMVSSPNGTTVAGRRALEAGQFKNILRDAVSAAKKRSEELGRDE